MYWWRVNANLKSMDQCVELKTIITFMVALNWNFYFFIISIFLNAFRYAFIEYHEGKDVTIER